MGILFPHASATFSAGVTPALALLLFATFLAIPMAKLWESFRNIRFLAAICFVNFLLVPVIAFFLTRFISSHSVLVVGVLLVLLAPCVDYVIVFTRAAGGAHEQLLAATPVLMLLQILLLPLYLNWFTGGEMLTSMNLRPFVEAFTVLILIPLLAAALVQILAQRFTPSAFIEDVMDLLMVPLMMLVLFLVIASQVFSVGTSLSQLAFVVPIYVAFLALMGVLGSWVAKLFKLEPRAQRAVVFSGATRNSLVVLPLALAMPPGYEFVPAVVVCQTIVEIIGMLAYTRLVPKLVSISG